MYKKRNRKNKRIYLIIIIIILLTLIYVSASNKKNYLFIEKIFHEIGNRLENIFIPKELSINEELINGINFELESELNDLKKIVGLEQDNYSFIYAKVIERDINWYNEIIINKGENDGIKEDMAVISTQGLIGRIIKTTANTSTIKLLTSNDVKVSVYIKTDTEEYHGIIDSYLEEGLIQINNVVKNSDIKVGNSIYTSGLGNIYPEGVYIGKVVAINYDSLGLSKIVKVKTDTSYDKIFYVGVVDRK